MSTPNPQDLLRQYNESLSHVLPKAVGTNLILWSSVSVGPFRHSCHCPSAHSVPLSSSLFFSLTFCVHETRYFLFLSHIPPPVARCRPGSTRGHRALTPQPTGAPVASTTL